MAGLFEVDLGGEKVRDISSLGLAHIGDAVYELLVRTHLCVVGKSTSAGLHKATVAHVSAKAQARVAGRVLPVLTESESAVFRRGRNTKVNSVPKNARYEDYHMATGLEALFGYLYLTGQGERISELFDLAMESDN